MKIRTLILGTASALVVAGGAQAADLAVAAPVAYVKVCDAYGVGYYYLPGTDTCIKLSTYVRETMGYSSAYATGSLPTANGHFWSQTEASIEATAKFMTSMGEGTIDVQMLEDTSEGAQVSQGVTLDHATAKIGGFTFGYQNTIAESVGPFTDYGAMRNDHKTDNFGYGFSAGGVGFVLGVEDNNTYWHNDSPDITAALTAGFGGLAFTFTGAAVLDRPGIGDGYGFNAGVTWGAAGGLQLAGNFAIAHNAAEFAGGDDLTHPLGTVESAFIAAQAPIGGGTLVQATVAWRDAPGSSQDTTHVAGALVFPVAQNLTLSTEGFYDDTDGVGSEGIFFRAKAGTP